MGMAQLIVALTFQVMFNQNYLLKFDTKYTCIKYQIKMKYPYDNFHTNRK